jgi:hypothetical protein
MSEGRHYQLTCPKNMTPDQEKDLFIKWSLYEPRAKRAMIEEYIHDPEGELSREL